ncbi:GumC family protein [Tunturiibacter lichenicola]|uniref:GumC family protein n=1 Tax=Tunturiibacter lichenicola TaxID=2051959 RepID=UPI003D9BF137
MNQPSGDSQFAEQMDLNSPAAQEESAGVSLPDIFRTLSSNKWLIVTCTVICLLCSFAYITVKKPVYEASATIRIDPGRAGSLGLSDLLSLAGGGSGDEIATETAVLKSDQVALAALNALTPEQFKTYAGFDKSQMNFSPTEQPLSRQEENLLSGFRHALGAKQVEGTQLIGLTFRHGNGQIAALLINQVIASYTRQNFDSRYNSVVQVRTWLSGQMDELRERAAVAQKKLAAFQEKNNLVGTDPSNNTIIDRLRLLNDHLTTAEGDRIVKEAQMRAAATGDPAILASLLPDPHLQSLEANEANLYTQYLQLSAKFGPAYPPLEEIKQQLAQIRSQIANDVKITSGRLREDYEATKQAEDMLREQFRVETEKAFALNRTQADYAVLVAEGTSSRDLYDTLQYKLQQASVDAGLNSVNTMIVDRARAAIDPVEPKKGVVLALGLLLGLATGIGASLLMASVADEIQSVSQLEQSSGLVSLASVPHLSSPAIINVPGTPPGKAPLAELVTLREPKSHAAESYRALRNSVSLSSIDRPAKSILVTSSLPGEGKSSTSANYAVVLAQRGSRVLLIDADLRRPTLHRHLSIPNQAGLGEYIIGDIGELNFMTPIPSLPNLQFVPAGKTLTFPSEALGSAKFHSLIAEWESQFDFVILDSAPILTVSDSLPLASWADTVILVARAGVTPLKALLRAKAVLQRAHARIAGVLLNDISNLGSDSGYYGKGGYDYYN